MRAVYNELEPFAAQWLRNLSAANRITPGAVDDRSIKELVASDVAAATQAHFFAGIGVWSYALRLAGWPDDAPVWTGSCPCQPFSVAGKQRGTDDERHLWPEWRRLIAECLPPVIFGEQVASRDGRAWLAAVRADLEALGYVVGAADLCAAGVGAPHIRQRLFFGAVRLGHADSVGAWWDGRASARAEAQGGGERLESGSVGHVAGTSGPDDSWASVEFVDCADGKARPVPERPYGDGDRFPQPLIRSLADGAPSRVGRLRAYGNAIVPQVAAAFIRSFVGACAEVAHV